MPPSQASNLAFCVVAIFASLLMVMQLPVHFQPTKSSNWLFIVWISMSMLNSAINAIIWNDNVVNWAPVWCDISSYITLAAGLGVQMALLCIARRVYTVVSGKILGQSINVERREMFWDIFVGIGIPILFLPLTYIVESNDFILIEQVGCYPSVLNTIPGILLRSVAPLIFSLISAVYSGLTLFRLFQRRRAPREFECIGQSCDNYEWRLALLSSTQIVLFQPIYDLVNQASGPLLPYSWGTVHADFSVVFKISIGQWTQGTARLFLFEWDRWKFVVYAFLYIAFVGWSEASRTHYKRHYAPIFFATARLFGYHAQNPRSHYQAARFDSDHGRGRRAGGLTFRTPLTSTETYPNTSHVMSSSQTITTASYHTANEDIVTVPRLPASVYHTPTSSSNDLDKTGVDYFKSLPPHSAEIAAPLAHAGDNVPAMEIVKPKPTYAAPASGAQSLP